MYSGLELHPIDLWCTKTTGKKNNTTQMSSEFNLFPFASVIYT